MKISGQKRVFPEGWAKRVSIRGRANGVVTSSIPGKLNNISEICSDYNNSKRSTEAVDRIIETIQQKRKQIQEADSNHIKSITYSSTQPTLLNSQSCNYKLPRAFVQRSRVQQIIDEFLYKARKRGLGGRSSKERNNLSEEIKCHPVNRERHQSGEGGEIISTVKEYLPPEVYKDFAFDANCNNSDTELNRTCSSGFYSRSFSIRSNSPDLFDQQENKVNSQTHLKQPMNAVDKQTNFVLFEKPCETHSFKSDYDKIAQTDDFYFSQNSRKMLQSPQIVEVPLSNNYPTNNFYIANDKSAYAMENKIIPTNLYHTIPHVLSQNQFDQYGNQVIRFNDVGLCTNCHMLYSKQTNTNHQIDNIFNFNPNFYQSIQNSNSTNKFLQDRWKFNFANQPCNLSNLNFHSIEKNKDEIQDFLDDYEFRHFMKAGVQQLTGIRQDNCCMHNFENVGSEQVSQHNFHKFTDKFTRAHTHSSKHCEPSPVFPFKVINAERNKLNETYVCNQDYQNEDIIKFFPNDDFSHGKNVNAFKHTDLKLESGEKVHSLGLSYSTDTMNNMKSATTSTVSTQTYSTDEKCEDTFYIPYRKQNNFNMEKTYYTKSLDASELHCETSLPTHQKQFHDESIITSEFTTEQLPVLSSVKNKMHKPLATSTPSGERADENKIIDERKSKMKTNQLTDVYHSFQIPRKITSDSIMNNMNESESFVILNLLKSAGKSVSFENIDNEE
ncbi:unnamed protein product [Schistosoma turkestanicum]|nr:unnamed protein product [Schistosoma turkestanicum]